MRHGEQIIVITTTEQAESVLEHLSHARNRQRKTITPASERNLLSGWNAAAAENRIKVDNGLIRTLDTDSEIAA